MHAALAISCSICSLYFFFFFKQKTAYEMRISDWSSDVCSSDLLAPPCVVGSVAPIAATPGTCGAVDWADTAIGSATNASAELARNQIDVRTTVSDRKSVV